MVTLIRREEPAQDQITVGELLPAASSYSGFGPVPMHLDWATAFAFNIVGRFSEVRQPLCQGPLKDEGRVRTPKAVANH